MAVKNKVNFKDITETFRTAGLLGVISAFLLVEGVVRTAFLVPTPSDKWGGDDANFPPAVMITGSVLEILFGLSGVFLAVSHLTFPYGSVPVSATYFSIACQTLGWFTFVVWTIASPAFNEAGTTLSSFPGLNKSQSRAITTMGILGSVAVCFSLQGAQFFLAFKILRIQKGDGGIFNGAYYRARLFVFSAFTLIGGGSQLAAGIILKHALGGGRYAVPVVAPPFIVFYPELTITTGAIVIVYAIVLLTFAAGFIPQSRSSAYGVAGLAFVVFLLEFAFQNLGQTFGGGALVVAYAQLVGLLFAIILFPAYLVVYVFADEEESDYGNVEEKESVGLSGV